MTRNEFIKWNFFRFRYYPKEKIRWGVLPRDKAICNAGSTNRAIVASLLWAVFLSSSSSWTLASGFPGSHCTCVRADLLAPDPRLVDLWSCCSRRPPLQMNHSDQLPHHKLHQKLKHWRQQKKQKKKLSLLLDKVFRLRFSFINHIYDQVNININKKISKTSSS